MSVLKRVAPASAFKVGLVIYGFVGLVLGAFCSLIALAGIQFAPHARMPFVGPMGILAIIFCPIIYGIIGGIGALVGAAVYNLAAGWVGGLEVDVG